MPNLQSLRVGALDLDALRALIDAGEPGGVERKVALPNGGLGPSVAAFANSGGGWLLLGVRDDGSIEGWSPPGTAQIHDFLRDHLRRAIDPLPGFNSQLLDTPDGMVGIVRVPQSPVRPHVVKEAGVVYEREPGGKRPIDSQAKLLAMSTQPERARSDALQRLSLPMVTEATQQTLRGRKANGQTRTVDWLVLATPLAVPEGFDDTVFALENRRAVERLAGRAVAELSEQSSQRHATPCQPRPRGLVIDGGDLATHQEAQLTVDAGGVVVARWSQRLFRNSEHLPGLVEGNLAPLLRLAVGILSEYGTVGRVLLHGYLRIRATDSGWTATIDVTSAKAAGRLSANDGPIQLGAELDLPCDEHTVRDQLARWTSELGRGAGLATWT